MLRQKIQFQVVQLLILFLLAAKVTIAQKETADAHRQRWNEPAGSETVKNPLTDIASAADSGKITYKKICSVCHGNSGKGDGIAAAGLNPKPANHTSVEIQKQSDGAIFWKTTTGRPPMAGYEKTFTAAQRWALVNYIRTLKVPDKGK